jgi:hypothetical protein
MSLNEEFGQINFDPTEEAEQRYNASAEEEKRKAALTAEEEAKKEEQEAQVAAKEAEQAKEDGKHLGDRVLDTPVVGQLASVGAGVIDTAFDVAGLVPMLKPADEWWDTHHGRDKEDNPLNKFIRDASGIIIPTLTGGGIAAKGLQGVAAAGKLGKGVQAASALKRTQVLGGIAVDLGISTGIEAVSEQTDEAGNLATALEDMLGVNIPWASRDSDSPDVIKAKNIWESVALGGVTGLLDAVWSLKKATKLVPQDKAAEEVLEARLSKESAELIAADGDELVAKVESARTAREAAVTDEALRRYDVTGGQDYDPYVNEPHLATDRPVPNWEADPILAKVDYVRMAKNIDVTDGRARPVVTDSYKRNLLNATAPGRNVLLKELNDKASPKFNAVIKTAKGVVTITEKEQAAAVRELTRAVTRLNPEEMEKLVKQTLSFTEEQLVDGGKKFNTLTVSAAKTATEALMKGLEIIDPQNLKASAMVVNQSAGDAADVSTAIGKMDGINTTSQQELAIDNLSILLREVGIHNSINGTRLQATKQLKLARQQNKLDTAWWKNEVDTFEEKVATRTRNAQKVATTLKEIAKTNPEYLKPLYREIAKTGGEVHDIHTLNKLVENRLGFFKKAFADGNSEMPSYLVQELQTARYNSLLTGLAPLRAASGAAIALVGKPLTVFAGSAGAAMRGGAEGAAAWKRAQYTFGGIMENFQRGFKNFHAEWKYALENPRTYGSGMRQDLKFNALDDYETLEELSEQWIKEAPMGISGKAAIWNFTKLISRINDGSIPRFGINAMRAIDGFTQSFTASMAARAKAYDTLFSESNGVYDDEAFRKMQRNIYNDMFNADGGPKTSEGFDAKLYAENAAGEINLNLDVPIVDSLETLMKKIPVMKSIFMFPRTGVNALQLAATFSPGNAVTTITNGRLNLALGKARRVLTAETPEQIREVLSEHGLTGFNADFAFRQLKSEYIGRHTMGSALVMGAALMAANGMMTGSGPQDGAEKRRMQAMGWEPFSFFDPITQKWRSYQGLEPFDTFLGLTADIVYHHDRVDRDTEDFLRAVVHAITMNISAKSFLSGFEPLAGVITGDSGELNKLLVNYIDSSIPMAGVRSILNKAITPQLKDVSSNFFERLANRNKWLVGHGLENYVDVYTGQPINYPDPMTRAWNTFAPFFKTNPGMEDWRLWMLGTGWDGLQTLRKNPITGETLTPEEKQKINNYIGQSYGLDKRVEKLMLAGPGFWDKKMKEYVKERGLKSQEEMPIKETLVHQLLDQIHNEAYKFGTQMLMMENEEHSRKKVLNTMRDAALNRGDIESAGKASDQIKKITSIPK